LQYAGKPMDFGCPQTPFLDHRCRDDYLFWWPDLVVHPLLTSFFPFAWVSSGEYEFSTPSLISPFFLILVNCGLSLALLSCVGDCGEREFQTSRLYRVFGIFFPGLHAERGPFAHSFFLRCLFCFRPAPGPHLFSAGNLLCLASDLLGLGEDLVFVLLPFLLLFFWP